MKTTKSRMGFCCRGEGRKETSQEVLGFPFLQTKWGDLGKYPLNERKKRQEEAGLPVGCLF